MHVWGTMILRTKRYKNTMGGIDYTKIDEITQDKMTDELFAAMLRHDDQAVFGMTSFGRNMGTKQAQGSKSLIAAAQDKKSTSRPRSKFSPAINLGPLTNIAMAETLLFETNGNVELAKLLAAKLQVNTLMSMDGSYSDEMAREMGAYGLSETLRQNQREEQNREVAYEQQQIEELTVTKEKDKTIWQTWFGEKEPVIEPIVAEPEKKECHHGFFSKFARGAVSALGLSKAFGMAAEDDAPEATPIVALQPAPVMNFIAPRFAMSGPKMF